MARGIFQIINVILGGGSPTRYTLTIANVTGSGPVVGDHVGTRINSQIPHPGAIYSIISVPSSNTIEIEDGLTEVGGIEFGQPLFGDGGYGTPEPNNNLTQLPFNAPGWDAMHRRNMFLLDLLVIGIGATGATGSTGATGVIDIATTISILTPPAAFDGTVAGDTVILTVGTSPLIACKIVLVRIDVVGLITPEIVSFGTTGDTGLDNIIVPTSLVGFDTPTSVYTFDIIDKTDVVTDELFISITAAVATTATFSVHVFGFEV